MKRILTKELHEHIGKEVYMAGWVHGRRDHGKLIFLDLRDAWGKVQMVAVPKNEEAHMVAETVRPEWVIGITGIINERPENMINQDEPNGDIEVQLTKITVINESKTPPFEIDGDTSEVGEESRLKYRYLDLRTDRMQKNIRMRDKVITFFREYMHRNDFVEIETPMLAKDTPEGSREYVVPSRTHAGRFYALPQAPQQFKQLCMVAGFEKYFQIARCMRDEDLRGDRQPEFTQLDFEMSFVEQEDILEYTEKMFIEMVKELYPEKRISETPFTRITYAESMEKYGTDKPDLRKDKNDPNELAFVWVLDFPMFEKLEDGSIQGAHHPFCQIHPEDKEKFMKGEDILSIRAASYDIVLNGYELSSGSIRIHERDVQKQVFTILGISDEEQEERFGHMLDAFTYGAPPHGGFAPGIDRILMILQDEPNIREVIAFPKNGEGTDLMMDSPTKLHDEQLSELHIRVVDDTNDEE